MSPQIKPINQTLGYVVQGVDIDLFIESVININGIAERVFFGIPAYKNDILFGTESMYKLGHMISLPMESGLSGSLIYSNIETTIFISEVINNDLYLHLDRKMTLSAFFYNQSILGKDARDFAKNGITKQKIITGIELSILKKIKKDMYETSETST